MALLVRDLNCILKYILCYPESLKALLCLDVGLTYHHVTIRANHISRDSLRRGSSAIAAPFTHTIIEQGF